MKIKVYSKAGYVKVENDKSGYDFYELKDGLHHLPHDGIYRDRDNNRPPIAIFVDGLICPVGSAQTGDVVDQIWNNMDTAKDSGHRPSISKAWYRSMAEMFGKLKIYLPGLIIVFLIVYALASTNGPLLPSGEILP